MIRKKVVVFDENVFESFVARDVDKESITCPIGDPEFDGYDKLNCNINGI